MVAAYAMVGAWTCLVLCALLAARRRTAGPAGAPEGRRPDVRRALLLAGVLGAGAAGRPVALVGLRETLDFAVDNTLGVIAGALVAASAVLGPLAVATVLPGPPRRVR